MVVEFNATETEAGFYVGAFAQIDISEKFTFQPEVMHVAVKYLDEIHISHYWLIILLQKSLGVMAGSALGILLDIAEGFSSFNYGIEMGAYYNITETFLVEARYSYGLTNLL